MPAGGAAGVTLGGEDAGQPGMLPRDASAEQIDAALRAVAAGLVVRPAENTRPAFGAVAEPEQNLLTPREVEVLAAIGNGLSNKAVARQLGISQHTVKFHVEALLRKLGAASRAEAVHKGLRQRLIEM
jgi:DNA-binding NarL/FixJ family response regulator